MSIEVDICGDDPEFFTLLEESIQLSTVANAGSVFVTPSKSEPPEKRGPQQNTIVNDQLEAAQSVQISAAHRQHVKDAADEVVEARDDSDT
jgi:hypothetical protein